MHLLKIIQLEEEIMQIPGTSKENDEVMDWDINDVLLID